MGVLARVLREVRYIRGVVRTLKRIQGVGVNSPQLACDDIENAVDKFSGRPALMFEGASLTYGEFDALANRYAHWAKAAGLKRGDTVALLAHNSLDYPAIWYGLSKVGVVTALLNNQLSGAPLAHSLTISQAAHVIVDADTAPAFAAVRNQLAADMTQWRLGAEGDLATALKTASDARPDRATERADLTGKDICLYLFTSGTTGLPKAAKVTHMRVQTYMRAFAAGADVKPSDRIYICLPLYHATGGMCAIGAGVLSGASAVIKRKFSASQFWPDIVAHQCTVFAYIGELCRYLVNQTPQPAESRHRVRLAFGNGLRPDVWEKMEARFKIPMILEFYGSTEGNVSILNLDGKTGAVGRVAPYLRSRFNVKLVKFDMETQAPVRNAEGRLIECKPDEVGEAIGKISADPRSNFVGYADKTATNRKVVHDAFAPGDAWFLTGDLLRQDKDGYFYFIDRVGDTFRWKGENVSTLEVEERLSELADVAEANVYGVRAPGADGRAGMAALVVETGFDLAAFQAGVEAALPGYAQPVFLRLQGQMETTGTFKRRKVDVAAEGFDPAKIADPLFVKLPGQGYTPIDSELHARLAAGEVRL
jgi:fatty-acyl-CoA synthase